MRGLQIGADFRDHKSGQKGLQIGAALGISNRHKKITNSGRHFKSGQKDFKSWQRLQIGAEQCYSANVRLFTYLDDKHISHELKILNYDELWENKKKISDEIRRFDRVKLID